MKGFSVLLYHEIIKKQEFCECNQYAIDVQQDYADILPARLFTYLEDFELQMKYLYEHGYHTLTLQEVYSYYYEQKPIPNRSVLITFDDMFISVLQYAYPILKKYQLHAVGFVVSSWLKEERVMYASGTVECMSCEQLNEMLDVFEYANHTHALHTKYFTSDQEMITALAEVSKEVFEKDLDICENITTYQGVFAYPFGRYMDRHVKWLKQMGYTIAFTCRAGRNTKAHSPHELCRDEVTRGITLDGFKQLLEGER